MWWDPHVLSLGAGSPFGLRRDDIIAKDGDPAAVAARLRAYEAWQADRAAAVSRARCASVTVRVATEIAAYPMEADEHFSSIEVVDVARSTSRPFGPRFGTLVHATLATVPLGADERTIRQVAGTHGRILLNVDEEVYAAVEVVTAVLRHALFDRVRAAEKAGKCYRELPIVWRAEAGALVEGTIDLVFEDEQGTTVVDFKTDREVDTNIDRYKRQVAIYCRAVSGLEIRHVRGVLVRL